MDRSGSGIGYVKHWILQILFIFLEPIPIVTIED
jgi:hypothetical protein